MIFHPFAMLILVPLASALLGYLIGRLRNEFSFIGVMVTLYYSIRLFIQTRSVTATHYELVRVTGYPMVFGVDQLSGFILLFVAAFSTLVLLYSLRYMRGRDGTRGYYFYFLLALSCANGVLLATDALVLLFFWGALLVILYGLLLVGRGDTGATARKALVVVGLSDFAMLLGIALLVTQLGLRVELMPRFPLSLAEPTAVAAFLLIAAGALAKAGSMPLHTWIPAAAKTAPATVMAFIPASLDKLLGIYLLVRLSVYMFDISSSPALGNVLMAVGAVTILAAVMMALVQKRAMRLLSFHAVSQVGYMVLGIGTGTAIGIAGGLFHMLNHALYKTGLFLSAGSVEHWTKDDELDKLGGLAGQMPVTFVSFAICALAIAGVPPLNGFVSKWMVYQGVLANGAAGNRLFPVFLVAAMLGSVLTLASFLKLMHAIFLGQRPDTLARVREVPVTMWLPPALMALTCVVFGVLAFPLPLSSLILPGLPFFELPLAGIWQPIPATVLGLVALGLGAIVYLLGTAGKPVAGRTFVGGEKIADNEESRVTGPAFYTSVKRLPIVGELLDFGERGAFDLYNWVTGLAHGIGEVARHGIDRVLDVLSRLVAEVVRLSGLALSRLQTGSLQVYVAWVFAGAAIFYLVLFLRCR